MEKRPEWTIEWDDRMEIYCLCRRIKDVDIIMETGSVEDIVRYCRENGIYLYHVEIKDK